jgi:hypothetical protein
VVCRHEVVGYVWRRGHKSHLYYKKVVLDTTKDAYLVTHTENVELEYEKWGKCQKQIRLSSWNENTIRGICRA